MGTIKVTFSFPEPLIKQLRLVVQKGGLSHFVTKAVENALNERDVLKAAYAAADDEVERSKVIEDWSWL